MKSYRLSLIAAVLAVVALVGSQPALAQKAPEGTLKAAAVKTMVVDLDKVQREALLFKDLRAKLSAFLEKMRAEEKAEREEMDVASQEFSRKRTILAPEAYAEERKKFEARVAEFQKRARGRQESMNHLQADGLLRAQKVVRGVLVDFANENHAAMIFRADMMAFYHPDLDNTDIIIAALNAKAPKIEIPAPTPAPAPAAKAPAAAPRK